jgi:hypothetical protein
MISERGREHIVSDTEARRKECAGDINSYSIGRFCSSAIVCSLFFGMVRAQTRMATWRRVFVARLGVEDGGVDEEKFAEEKEVEEERGMKNCRKSIGRADICRACLLKG